MEYIPPFGFERINKQNEELLKERTPLHDVMGLVYKQKGGQVDMIDERQSGCDGIESRIVNYAALEQKYDLELVAGTFFYTTYTSTTNALLCYYSKCLGEPWPYPAPGMNDGPDCQ